MDEWMQDGTELVFLQGPRIHVNPTIVELILRVDDSHMFNSPAAAARLESSPRGGGAPPMTMWGICGGGTDRTGVPLRRNRTVAHTRLPATAADHAKPNQSSHIIPSRKNPHIARDTTGHLACLTVHPTTTSSS